MRGNLEPIGMECQADVPPATGAIPQALRGTLYRNGPSPRFPGEAHRFAGFGRLLPDAPAGTRDEGGVANTDIVWHGGRLLALEEQHLPVELEPGEMLFFGYAIGLVRLSHRVPFGFHGNRVAA